jgi:ferredoxin--NADP+ reductase
VVVDNHGEPIEVVSRVTDLLAELARRPRRRGRRAIVLRFSTAPLRVVGDTRVSGIEVGRTVLSGDGNGVVTIASITETETLETGLVVRSVGVRGRAVPGLPFDDATGTVPNDKGRVVPGTYVTGWIKRGPRGFIGTNKLCAEETVDQLLDDLTAGAIATPVGTEEELERLLLAAQPDVVTSDGWRAIDEIARRRGEARGRVRDKLTDVEELVAVARSGAGPAKRRRARPTMRSLC